MMFAFAARRRDERAPFVPAGWLIVSAVVFLVCVTASTTWQTMGSLTFLLAAAGVALRLPLKTVSLSLRSGMWMLILAAAFHLVFRLLFLSNIPDVGWSDHMTSTVFFLNRLVLFLVSTALLIHCHSPVTYAQAVARTLGIITGWKIAKQAGQVAHLALSMLPQIERHVAQRKLARRLRGVAAMTNFRGRLTVLRDDLSSTVQFALSYANTLATVLWSRGYRPETAMSYETPRSVSYRKLATCCLFCLSCLITLQR